MGLLEGPDLQTVDVKVLLGGQWLVVKGGTFGGGPSVQLGVQPQTQLTTAEEGSADYWQLSNPLLSLLFCPKDLDYWDNLMLELKLR